MGGRRIVLVRHGQTDFNVERRFQGRADQPLNERGMAQARAAAGVLATDPREPDTPWDGPGAGAPAALDPGRPMGLVRQFHQTYSVPDRLAEHAAPTLDYERLGMRVALVSEEYAELIGAVYGPAARSLVEEAARAAADADEGVRDVVEAADALADLVYVVYGMALSVIHI